MSAPGKLSVPCLSTLIITQTLLRQIPASPDPSFAASRLRYIPASPHRCIAVIPAGPAGGWDDGARIVLQRMAAGW